jgi:hypothetical protein
MSHLDNPHLASTPLSRTGPGLRAVMDAGASANVHHQRAAAGRCS